MSSPLITVQNRVNTRQRFPGVRYNVRGLLTNT